MTPRKIQYWVIPPEANGEFVACMENVLETYAQPYDARFPVVCMDEQPVQLLKETRAPIAATKHHARRVDYEYERAGPASCSCLPSRFRDGAMCAFGATHQSGLGLGDGGPAADA